MSSLAPHPRVGLDVEVRASKMRNIRTWVSPSQGSVQSYSGSNQNQLFLNYTQQTSQDNPRLSLTPTTPKKEENKDYLGDKQNLKILIIHFSKINTDHNLVPGES